MKIFKTASLKFKLTLPVIFFTHFLLSIAAYAQYDSVKTLVSKLGRFYEGTLQEKIFINTDRTFYLTGEIIWFKIYCVDASLNHPLHTSKVAYVEILDKEHSAVLQTKVAIDGTGEGSLFLPPSLQSGNYTLRAYTNWMKNFSADLFFHETITIVNPFAKLSATATAGARPEYDVQFFPEGGNLVYGIKTKVAFRAVDRNGKGIDFTGTITDENNTAVSSFKPLKFGIGNFMLTPVPGHHYKAIITDASNKIFTYSLPTPLKEGFTLNLNDSTSQIIINSNNHFENSSSYTAIYLLAHAKQRVIFCEKRSLQSGTASFSIDKQKLPEGISHFTIFTDSLRPVCERLYFKPLTQQLNLSAKTDVKQYATRKKVRMDLMSTEATGNKPDMVDLSISVYREDSLSVLTPVNIKEYLELTSDLTGNIESPSWYLNGEFTEEKKRAADNLMLTHGWSRFKWDQILSGKNNFSFLPEIRSHIVTGSIKNAVSGLPEKNIAAFLVSPQKNAELLVAKSKSGGEIQFEIRNFFGSRDIAVTTKRDSIYSIQLANPFSGTHASYQPPIFSLDEKCKINLEARAINMQVQNIFFDKQLNKFKKPVAGDSVPFYGLPDKRYFLDDYTRFPTMEEVMREYVAEVLVRRHNKQFYFYNRDDQNNAFFNDEPLILLDGIPVFNTNKIISFDPRKIKRLDVMAKTYFLGPFSFPGIVSYSTYKGDLGGYQLDAKTLFVNYEGMQLQREFFSPIYETQESKSSSLPDVRNLLYWSASVKTDNDGKAHVEFFTSDVTGKFKVNVQGLSKDGKPTCASTTFEVSDKLNY